MKANLDMIGIISQNFKEMVNFYEKSLGFEVLIRMDEYVEFKNEKVRLAISSAEVMQKTTGLENFKEKKRGHAFELAFKVDEAQDVDEEIFKLRERGVKIVKDAENKEWGQRAAFFCDPDGNVHEIFADL